MYFFEELSGNAPTVKGTERRLTEGDPGCSI